MTGNKRYALYLVGYGDARDGRCKGSALPDYVAGYEQGQADHAMAAKRYMYRNCQYRMPAPPVTHAQWNEDDWIRYIDKHGSWIAS